MKKTLQIICLAFLIQANAAAQSCLPEGITFYTQEEIDNFSTNYPNCSEIEGYVNIVGTDNITNLTGLNSLNSIGGSLTIRSFEYLNGLNGLENVSTIGSDLSITYTDLTNLDGLENLTTIGGELRIFSNSFLLNIDALENVSANSMEEIYIYNNPLLSDCNAQSICDYIADPPGIVNIYNNANGCNNPSQVSASCGNSFSCLTYGNYYFTSQNDIDDFELNYPDCSELNGSVTINGADIVNLDGLSSVISVDDLFITTNPLLDDINGISNVNIIGNLTIEFNPLLTSCSISSLCSYLENPSGSIDIYNNGINCNNPSQIAENCGFTISCLPYGNYNFKTQSDIDNFPSDFPECTQLEGDVNIIPNYYFSDVTNLDSLINITSISGNVKIWYQTNLESLSGLDNLSSIGGYLDIYENIELSDLTGLGSLQSIGDDGIWLTANNSMTSLNGMDNLSSIDGWIGIIFNLNLTSINVFSNIDSISKTLYIGINPILTDLSGLENLASIGGDLRIRDNDLLYNLSPLNNLSSINGYIQIENNELLNSLNGLDNIDSETISNLRISGNPSLSYCNVESVCDYLIAPNGTVTIFNNDDGCNSQIEIENACDAVGISENEKNHSLSIFPNPASTSLTIIYVGEIEKLSLYSVNGQLLYSQYSQLTSPIQLNVSDLEKGVYFMELMNENGSDYLKFVKK